MTTLKSIIEAQRLEIAAKVAKHDFKENRKSMKYDQALAYMVANEQMMFNTLKRVQGRSAKVANWLRLLDNMAKG